MASRTDQRTTTHSQDDSDIVTSRRTRKQRSAYRKTWPFCDRMLQAIPENTIVEWTSPEPSIAEEPSPTQSLKLKRKSKVMFNSPTLQESNEEDSTEVEPQESSAEIETSNTVHKALPLVPSNKDSLPSTATHLEDPEITAELRILRAQVVWTNYHLTEAQVQERRLENKIAELEKVCKSQGRIVDKLSDQMNLWQTSHDIIESELEEAMEDIEQAKIYMGELELANTNLRVQMSRMQEQTVSRSPGSLFFGWLRRLLPKRLLKVPKQKTP